MITETIDYDCKGFKLQGYLVYSGEVKVQRPCVIVAHAWKGLDDFARQKAYDLAELGYVGFAADVYGRGILAKTNDEALKLMTPLFQDRQLLRERINAAVDVIKNHPRVDPTSIGAIGFCFGGLTVIELMRSGTDISGVVSFHGVLGNTLGEVKAFLAPPAPKIEASILILHGNDDPLVSKEDILNIQQEFTQSHIDWQMNIYGHAAHAFTNPDANDVESGMIYNTKANMRSWLAMCDFFDEVFP